MALLSFKDVGTTGVRRIPLTEKTTVLPIGFKTPLELDTDGNAIFKMHTVLKDQIADNLRNLILTNHGERLALFDLGANLRPLLTEWSNKDNFDQEAMIRIKTAIGKYMPFVEPAGFDSRPDYHDNTFTGKIQIFIAYGVPSLGLTSELLQINLNVI